MDMPQEKDFRVCSNCGVVYSAVVSPSECPLCRSRINERLDRV